MATQTRLLQLARAEGGTQQVVIAEYRLDEIVLGSVEKLRVLADEKEQEIVTRLAPCTVAVDRLLFEQAFQNVLDNAIKHTPHEARIEVSTHETAHELEIAVSDDGPGIEPGYRERITNRFFQATKTGASAGGGVGLGLAITESYMRVLGGRLLYEPVLPHGSKFRLLVPKQLAIAATQRARLIGHQIASASQLDQERTVGCEHRLHFPRKKEDPPSTDGSSH